MIIWLIRFAIRHEKWRGDLSLESLERIERRIEDENKGPLA